MINPSIIKAKYKRSKINPEKTFLWSEMPSDLKSKIKEGIQFDEEETPIICFYNNDYTWILTNCKLITITSGSVDYYPYNDIEKIEPRELFDEAKSKLANDSLTIILKNGDKFSITVELGTWHVLYNIIRFLINSVD